MKTLRLSIIASFAFCGALLAYAPIDCTRTSVGLAPSDYVRVAEHTDAGLLVKAGIVRRDGLGQPSPTGRIALVIGGMSNARIVGLRQRSLHLNDVARFPGSEIVVGAQDGQTANAWADPNNPAWSAMAHDIANRGLTSLQVQAFHFTLTQKEPLTYGAMTEAQVRAVVNNVAAKYPNVKVLMLSGLAYTGYSTEVNRAEEPFIHDDSILLASLVTAGGFPIWTDFTDLWADGTTPNPLTGLFYICTDYEIDGIHPSTQGRNKIAMNVMGRWKADPVFRGWLYQ